MKILKILQSWRIWLLVIALLFSLISISPYGAPDGVAIRSVAPGSPASFVGLEGPEQNTQPRSLEVITSINNIPISDLTTYYEVLDGIEPSGTTTFTTTDGTYTLDWDDYLLQAVQEATVNATNETEETITASASLDRFGPIGSTPFGLSVSAPAGSNLRKGLDLDGGTRVLIEPDEPLSEGNYSLLRTNLEQRLNVYGLSDVRVTIIRDAPKSLGGTPQYILLEIAGASVDEVQELVEQQGSFIATIDGKHAFTGENEDIRFVAHAPPQAGIGPGPCTESGGVWTCPYFFALSLSPQAAERVAGITGTLDVITNSNGYSQLSAPIEFYLDGTLTNNLSIAADLKGRATTDIQITGIGNGPTERDAGLAALEDMKQLQAIIETGSLPTSISVIKADTISPLVGDEFLRNSGLVALLSIIGVGLVVFIRYRSLKVSLPMVITAMSELAIVLGVAALIKWQIDLPAIAGLVIIIGSSVDHQIVITDELLGKLDKEQARHRRRMRNAFFIITAAYLTTVSAMVPLMFAGAGLLKNFALTTIIGITVGVLISRPAFAKVLEILHNKDR